MFETLVLGIDTTRKDLKLVLSTRDLSLPLSTLVDTLMSFYDKMDQAFLYRFSILQAITNLTVGRPGNEASRQHITKCSNEIKQSKSQSLNNGLRRRGYHFVL